MDAFMTKTTGAGEKRTVYTAKRRREHRNQKTRQKKRILGQISQGRDIKRESTNDAGRETSRNRAIERLKRTRRRSLIRECFHGTPFSGEGCGRKKKGGGEADGRSRQKDSSRTPHAIDPEGHRRGHRKARKGNGIAFQKSECW